MYDMKAPLVKVLEVVVEQSALKIFKLYANIAGGDLYLINKKKGVSLDKFIADDRITVGCCTQGCLTKLGSQDTRSIQASKEKKDQEQDSRCIDLRNLR